MVQNITYSLWEGTKGRWLWLLTKLLLFCPVGLFSLLLHFFHFSYYTCLHVCSVASIVSDSLPLLNVAWQAPQSMGFSRQEYWSGLSCPPPEDLPNPGLPHCRWIIYQLSHQESPRIPEWVAYPFSSGSFWPRNKTRVSYFCNTTY